MSLRRGVPHWLHHLLPALLGVILSLATRPCLPEASNWHLPEQALFFIGSEQRTWSDQPSDQREWIRFARPELTSVYDATRWQDQAYREIAVCIRPPWLPNPEFIQIVGDANQTSPTHMYWHCCRVGAYGIAYMGACGDRFLLYIEQPDPLPEGQKRLTRADVLRDDLLQTVADEHGATSYPRVQFVAREMKRYRALSHQGPYEPVHILLVDARLSDDVNLRSPGYE